MPRNEMSTASWKKFWANGISKKAIAGIPVLARISHDAVIVRGSNPR
jgi:hypothetical protein